MSAEELSLDQMMEIAGTATPKERPILFQGAMVRALLSGTKTQTRRLVKPQPQPGTPGMTFSEPYTRQLGVRTWLRDWGNMDMVHCPYGQPGDRLWVRESFIHEPADYCWEASVSIPSRPASTVYRADFPDSQPGEGWKPSIHMPRKLSRITLEITDVRVQRLQDISETDALAEGIYLMNGRFTFNAGLHESTTAVESYRALWESINGPGSWDANPWVWAVSFRRINTIGRSAPAMED